MSYFGKKQTNKLCIKVNWVEIPVEIWFWKETTNRSDCLITKSSKSGTPTKHQLADISSVKTINHLLKKSHQKEKKKSKKPFVSEKNHLPRLSFACEHISENIDEWKWVLLNSNENLRAELLWLTKDRKLKNGNELFAVIKNGLQVITKKYLHQLIQSMPCWCKAVIKSKGVTTKYWMVHTVGMCKMNINAQFRIRMWIAITG